MPCSAQSPLRNYDIAANLGCLDAVGLAETRRDKSPTVQKGLSVPRK